MRTKTPLKEPLIESVKAVAADGVRRSPEKAPPFNFLPTGSALYNLALSNRVDGGYAIGKIGNLIGDSHSGKTLLALSMFAEAAKLKRFDDYRFIYDDVEAANEFNIKKMFGRGAARRIEPVMSDTIEDFRDYIDELMASKVPFIYVLDSADALDTKASERKKGEGYDLSKPKMFSKMLGRVSRKLKRTKSFLLIISQTRENITAMFNKRTRSGGKALKFYAAYEAWLAVIETVKKAKVPIGSLTSLKVSKNKVTGAVRTINLPIYGGYGVDDIGSCVDYLIERGAWSEAKRQGRKVVVNSLCQDAPKDELVAFIEEDASRVHELHVAVQNAWDEFEESLRIKRRPRYE